ncbi:hypothetical protein C0J52_26498 [Blattella germanica]|nr:hypothetical protein C0J52_26498 [Blattella germanica]
MKITAVTFLVLSIAVASSFGRPQATEEEIQKKLKETFKENGFMVLLERIEQRLIGFGAPIFNSTEELFGGRMKERLEKVQEKQQEHQEHQEQPEQEHQEQPEQEQQEQQEQEPEPVPAPRLVRSARPEDQSEGIHAGINQQPGVGTVVDVSGRKNVYETDDGRGRVNVEGQWSKVIDGPGRGKPQAGAGINFEYNGTNMKITAITFLVMSIAVASSFGRPQGTEEEIQKKLKETFKENGVMVLLERIEQVAPRLVRSARPEDQSEGIHAGINQQPGVGTVVDVSGRKNIYETDDGRGRVNVEGQWSKVTAILFLVLAIVVASAVAKPHHHPDHKEDDHQEQPQENHSRVVRSPQPEDKKGNVHGGVHEESGKGVVADIHGKGTVWESKDGKSRVQVEGDWSKVIDGPQRGKPQHRGGRDKISAMKVSAILFIALSIAVASTLARPHHHPDHKEDDHQEQPQETHTRVERSPQDDKKVNVHGGIHEQSGVGVVADVHGQGTVWKSDDGKRRVNVEGNWSKVLDGPQRGKPQHSAGVSFDFDW